MKIVIVILLFCAWGAMAYFLLKHASSMNKMIDEQRKFFKRLREDTFAEKGE